MAGFTCAFYLINSSYDDWQASPIATPISTHPISELQFPTITVCPPEGSNTALNYDLIRSRNITLTEKERHSLLSIARHMLIDKPSSDFVKMARALTNDKNIPQVYDNIATQSYPIPSYDENGYVHEIWSSQLDGSYETPGFGQISSCNESFPSVHFSLLKEVEDSILEIEFRWQEHENLQIEYRKGPKYVFYDTLGSQKTWQKAEEFCQQKNGHLAKAENLNEMWEIRAGQIKSKTWLGATDAEIENEWVWSDGSPWLGGPNCKEIQRTTNDQLQPCTSWDLARYQPLGGRQLNCLIVWNNVWNADDCSTKNRFICKISSSPITSAKQKEHIVLTESDFRQINFWQTKKSPYACKPGEVIPGFSMSWKTRMRNKTILSNKIPIGDLSRDILWDWGIARRIKDNWMRISKKVKYEIVQNFRKTNMTTTEIWNIVRECKREVTETELFRCDGRNVNQDDIGNLFNELKKQIPDSGTKISYTETKEDMILAFDIFSYMTFCHKDATALEVFYEKLLPTGDATTILQATVNNLKLGISDQIILESLQHLYQKLTDILRLHMANILVELSNSNALQTMESEGNVFLTGFDEYEVNMKSKIERAMAASQPVEMYDKPGELSPSAFVPFCAFGTELLGPTVQNMSTPVCNIFDPTVVEGRLCYQTNVEKLTTQHDSHGKKSGLILFIDTNKEKSIKISKRQKAARKSSLKRIGIGNDLSSSENQVSIHIETLARFKGYGPGRYVMTSMKQMSGTDGFLAWPEEKRKCSLENDEKCRMKVFREMVNHCGCLPFQLVPAANGPSKQVTIPINAQFESNFFLQICSPAGLDCFQNFTSSTCKVACQGLYADVNQEQG